MANNRMILLCNVCVPTDDWHYRQHGVFALAKWYPGGMEEEGAPYYSNRTDEQLGSDLLEFLDEHKHGEVASEHYTTGAGQENPVRLTYESIGLPILKSQTTTKES